MAFILYDVGTFQAAIKRFITSAAEGLWNVVFFSLFFLLSLWQTPLIYGETEAHGYTSLELNT